MCPYRGMNIKIRLPLTRNVLEARFRSFLLPLVPSHLRGDPLLDLENTPARVTRMWSEELLYGYTPEAAARLEAKFKTFPTTEGREGMVVESGISFTSTCAHHLLPFTGVAHFGYVPRERIMGLSKVAWVVDHYAAQLQLQERMTNQVAEYLNEKLDPVALIVVTEAVHQCMACRGPRKAGVVTTTAALRGKAWDGEVRQEFYTLIRRGAV